MKTFASFCVVAFALVAGLSGCLSDKVATPTKPPVCDSGLITYTRHVAPLLARSCNTAGCHNERDYRSSGVPLYDYENAKFNTEEGRVLCAVKHTGCLPMPRGASKLSVCDINLLQAWADSGFKE